MIVNILLATWRRGVRQMLRWIHPAIWIIGLLMGVWAVALASLGVAVLGSKIVLGLLWASYAGHSASKWSEIWKPLIYGSLVTAGVGIVQYFANHSVGLRLLGESILDPARAGTPVVVADELRQLRAHGLMPHANIFGGILALVWTWLIQWRMPGQRGWTWLAAVLLAVGVAVSFGRVAWLVFLVGLVVGGIGKLMNRQKYNAAGLAIGGLAFAVALASQWQYVIPRFAIDNSLEQRSISERAESLEVARQIWPQNTIIGMGPGQYTLELTRLYPDHDAWWYQPVHNGWLVLLLEWGGVGILALLLLVGWLTWRYRRGWQVVGLWVAGLGLLALVDHWPMTLHQGRMAWFVALIAMIWWHQHLSYKSNLDYNPK